MVAGSDFVFHTKAGQPIYPRVLARHFEHLRQQANLPAMTLHGLRHTNASRLLEMGVPIKVVSKRLGHATTSITMDIYAHVGWE